jgi:hypothetical protein
VVLLADQAKIRIINSNYCIYLRFSIGKIIIFNYTIIILIVGVEIARANGRGCGGDRPSPGSLSLSYFPGDDNCKGGAGSAGSAARAC